MTMVITPEIPRAKMLRMWASGGSVLLAHYRQKWVSSGCAPTAIRRDSWVLVGDNEDRTKTAVPAADLPDLQLLGMVVGWL